MAGFGKKRKITEYFYSKTVIAVLLVIIVFLSISVYERFTVEREMVLRHDQAQKEMQELLQRKATLEERVEYLSGERGIEEEIRKHFDVAKEGEKVIIIVDDKESETKVEAEVPQEKPWYQFW